MIQIDKIVVNLHKIIKDLQLIVFGKEFVIVIKKLK